MNKDKLLGKFNFFKSKSNENTENTEIESLENTEEEKINEQLETETNLLLEATKGLENDLNEFGSEDELKEAFEDNPEIKESFFSKHWILSTVLLLQSASLAGSIVRDQFPGEFWNKLGNIDSGDIKLTTIVLSITALYAFIKYLSERNSDKKNYRKTKSQTA